MSLLSEKQRNGFKLRKWAWLPCTSPDESVNMYKGQKIPQRKTAVYLINGKAELDCLLQFCVLCHLEKDWV